MADVERIAPPVPTLPSPIGRGVGSRRRQAPQPQRQPPSPPQVPESDQQDSDPSPAHINEYV
jgi:hypothetical protein